MTLKQAFTIWAYDQKNTVLAAKSRDAVQRVLMKMWNDIDLEQVTETFARKIFTTSSAPQELKTKAASILVQLLQWGSENGHCQPPSFSYDIASEDYGKEKKIRHRPRPVVPSLSELGKTVLEPEKRPDAPVVRVKPEALAKRKAELAARNKPKTDTTMEEKKKSGRKPRPLAQIDPHTLEVVKVWPTMKDAERALNACNLDRAAKRIRKSAGFYWSDADQVATFRERLDAKERGISLEENTVCQPAPGKQDGKSVTAEPEQAVKAPVEQPQEAPSEPAVTPPAFQYGDRVRAKKHKDLQGLVGILTSFCGWSDKGRAVYGVNFGERVFLLRKEDIELADEENTVCQPAPGKQDGKSVTAEPEQDVKASAEQSQETSSEPAVTPSAAPKFKVGDRVCARQPKEIYGRTGYIVSVDTVLMMYVVVYGGELFRIAEKDLELVGEAYAADYIYQQPESKSDKTLEVNYEIADRPANGTLGAFTDEELWKELERRGWQGEISKVQVIAIGKK